MILEFENINGTRTLCARISSTNISTLDEYFDKIQKWCQDNQCGRRVSYAMFQFTSLKSMSLFLMTQQGKKI